MCLKLMVVSAGRNGFGRCFEKPFKWDGSDELTSIEYFQCYKKEGLKV